MFLVAAAMSVVGAIASLFRGGRYVHVDPVSVAPVADSAEGTEVEQALQGGGLSVNGQRASADSLAD